MPLKVRLLCTYEWRCVVSGARNICIRDTCVHVPASVKKQIVMSLRIMYFAVPCIPGTSGTGGNGMCRPCQVGWYQTNFASGVCTECPLGMATHENGSVSLMQCIVPKAGKTSTLNSRNSNLMA